MKILLVALLLGPLLPASTFAKDEDASVADSSYERGIALRDNNELDRAIAKFNEALTHHSESDAIFYARGTTWRWMGEHGKALADFETAVKLNPKNPTYAAEAQNARDFKAHGLMRKAVQMRRANDIAGAKAAYDAAMDLMHTSREREFVRRYHDWELDRCMQQEAPFGPPGDFLDPHRNTFCGVEIKPK